MMMMMMIVLNKQ